jgi:hypothetical protein
MDSRHRHAGHWLAHRGPGGRRFLLMTAEHGTMVAEARDRKVVRGWFYWDQLALLTQLDITEQPGLFLATEGF